MITPVITLNTGPWEFKGTLTIEGSPRSRADRLCQRGRFPGRDLLGFPAGSSGRPTCSQQEQNAAPGSTLAFIIQQSRRRHRTSRLLCRCPFRMPQSRRPPGCPLMTNQTAPGCAAGPPCLHGTRPRRCHSTPAPCLPSHMLS